MQDYFWSAEGRQNWPNPEPANVMFLGQFFVDLGTLKYGLTWDGLSGKPDPSTSIVLQKAIAQEAASGVIKTLVMHPITYEYIAIQNRAWRKEKALGGRFSHCKINATDQLDASADGKYHGYIFVERESAIAHLEALERPYKSSVLGGIYRDRNLSTYLRYAIEMSQQEKLDDSEPGNYGDAGKLKTTLSENWSSWRRTIEGSQTLPESAAVLTKNVLDAMALLMRGERKRLATGGGVERTVSNDTPQIDSATDSDSI